MISTIKTTSLLVAAVAATGAAATGVSCTPHDSYSSSVGVLGCKVNTDRIAYWPGSVGCDNICIKLTKGSRSVHLLRVDQSGGAHDISYDAWVYLQTGQPASSDPIAGGGVDMEYEEVPASECASLLDNGKVPLSAANSMGYVSACLAQPDSFVAKNYVLYNIADAICSMGVDEKCTLDLAVSNQPSCPHQLGLQTKLTTTPVYNVMYQTGKTVNAATGEEAPARAATGGSDSGSSSSSQKQAAPVQAQQAPPASSSPAPAPVAQPVVASSAPAPPPAPTTTSQAPPPPPPQPTTTKTPAGAVFVPETPSSAAVQSSSSSSSSVPAAPRSTSTSSTSQAAPSSSKAASSSSSSAAAYTTMSKVTTVRVSTAAGTGSPSGAARPSTVPQGTPAVVPANAAGALELSSAALAIVAGAMAVLAAF
ncbi:uncharacterized protein E0L32_005264 [Thyridium curvatum]|uniref:Uncharacterized protein n=1 Tax=Thyridium curvatum TaxID=1093900 RepID=A0A507AX90_9PEZI|nr:uncharacterized protein E0L32_005264 [Thyridium curvatum]TPX14572.1 hypothetical protein E0L32_005264 [Thyridium curvatum]